MCLQATAIELSKVQAPALKLYEFNYFFNQAIRQFVNKVYNVYDVNQQTTDDLRVLKATATLLPEIAPSTGNKALDYLRGATYYVNMPDDYLHLLNCICLFDVNKNKECWNKGDVMVVGATKLTDIIVMNDIPGLTEQYQLSIDNNILIGVPDNFSSALGNPNKLYVWFSSNDYSIFVYNPKNNQYMRLGSSISVDSENVNSDSNPINFVESAEDIADPSKYEPKTWVYYPQP